MQNLQTISTKELRDNLAEILEKVAIGKESYIVSKFGRQKALIAPISSSINQKKTKFKNLAAFGLWEKRPDIKNSSAWVSKLRTKQSQRKT